MFKRAQILNSSFSSFLVFNWLILPNQVQSWVSQLVCGPAIIPVVPSIFPRRKNLRQIGYKNSHYLLLQSIKMIQIFWIKDRITAFFCHHKNVCIRTNIVDFIPWEFVVILKSLFNSYLNLRHFQFTSTGNWQNQSTYNKFQLMLVWIPQRRINDESFFIHISAFR